MLDFNTYLEEKKKKEVVKINPKKEDLYEKDHKAEDCTGSDHTKSEKKRRKEDVNDGPDVQNEQSLKPSDRFKRDAGAIAKKKLRQKEHNKYVNFLDVDEEKKPFPDKKVDKKLSSLRDKMKSKPYGFKRSDEKNRSMKISGIKDAVKRGEDPRSDTRGGAYAKRGNPPEDHRKHFTKTPLKNRPVKPAGVKNEEFENVDESRLTGANDMQSKLYAANNKSGKKMTDDEIKKQKGGKEFLDRIKAAKAKMSEGVYTGPDKKDRAVIKKMDNKKFAAKLADYEKNMDPKKRQALKDKATKGMKFVHEEGAPTMNTGSNASAAGFSSDADENGPTAGMDQPLGGTAKLKGKGPKLTKKKAKCKKSPDGINKICESTEARYLSFLVQMDDVEFIFQGKSPADVKIRLRKIYRPERLKGIKITRMLPAQVMHYYWEKRQAAM
jgi:hypothetical protein